MLAGENIISGLSNRSYGLKTKDRRQRSWKDLSYTELAFRIISLYISSCEIPAADLKAMIDRSYSTFRAKDVAPLVHLQDNNLYLLELFHGPSYSFKDCAFCEATATSLSLHPIRRLAILGKPFRIFSRAEECREGRKRWVNGSA